MNETKERIIRGLIAERARAKRDRGGIFHRECDCGEYGIYPFLPFQLWLLWTEGCTDWRKLSRYKLWNLFCDYQLECVRLEYDWENPKIYGLDNCLP